MNMSHQKKEDQTCSANTIQASAMSNRHGRLPKAHRPFSTTIPRRAKSSVSDLAGAVGHWPLLPF
jgi:hypothetical protein